MSNENKKIKDIFDQQRVNLPEGFWEKLEPNIPEYKKKRNHFLGLPLWGCLGVFFIIGTVAIIGYSTYKINETTNLLDKAFESATNNSKLKMETDEALVSEKDSREVSLVDRDKSTGSSTENNKENVSDNTTEIGTNNKTKSTAEKRNAFFNETNKDLEKQNIKVSRPLGSNSINSFNKGGNASIILSTSPNNIVEKDGNQKKLTNASKVDIDGRNVDILSDKKNTDLETIKAKIIDPITALSAFVTTNKELVEMEFTKVENQETVFERKSFLEGGYNTVFAQRTITSDTRNSWRSNKTKYEKDFISHEGYINYGKYLNKNIYITGGMRYTVIQELFDFSYDTISTENFSFMKGKRSIQHTNKLHMLDASIGIGIEQINNRFIYGGNLWVSYNVLFLERGVGLNNKDLLQNIQDSDLYVKNSGLSIGANLYLGYALKPNIELKLNVGVRSYLKDFGSDREGFPIGFRYKAVNLGLGVRYLF